MRHQFVANKRILNTIWLGLVLGCVAFQFGCGKTRPMAKAAKTTGPAPQKTTKHLAEQPLPKERQRPEIVWRYRVKDASFQAQPLFADGVLYVGSSAGTLHAIDAAKGDAQWIKQWDTAFASTVAKHNNSLFVGDLDGTLHCVETRTGEEKWSFVTPGPISAGVTFYKNRVLVASQGSTLHCLHAGTGEVLWTFQAADQLHATPRIVDNYALIVASCRSLLQVVDVRTGKIFREYTLPAESLAEFATDGDWVIAATMRGDAVCVDWQQAQQEWTKRLNDRVDVEVSGGVALHGDSVIVGASDHFVRALGRRDGQELWQFRARGRIDAVTPIYREQVFVTTTRGYVYALDAKAGKLEWSYETGGGYWAAPTVVGQHVFTANDNGFIYCIAMPADK